MIEKNQNLNNPDQKNIEVAKDLNKFIEELKTEKESRVNRDVARLADYLKGFGLETSNFDYMRIRLIASQVFDEIVGRLEEKAKQALISGEEIKYSGPDHFSLYRETQYRYFLQEFGIYPDELSGMKDGKKLGQYLAKLKEEKNNI
ncbi:MAG: hypothetical protein WCV55_03330 [Candidatus Paceibacterota bacterium]